MKKHTIATSVYVNQLVVFTFNFSKQFWIYFNIYNKRNKKKIDLF